MEDVLTRAKGHPGDAGYYCVIPIGLGRAHHMGGEARSDNRVVHQLAPRIIHRIQDVRTHKGVEIMLSVDGIGARGDKEATWRKLVEPLPSAVRPGFKLFFEEDTEHGKLMTPKQVLKLKPTPDYVLYE